MKVCKKCKTKNQEGNFCKKCGGELEEISVKGEDTDKKELKKGKNIKIKYCKKCDKQYMPEDKFCSICSEKLESREVKKEELDSEVSEKLDNKRKKNKKIMSIIAAIVIVLAGTGIYKSYTYKLEIERQNEEQAEAERQQNLANLKYQFLVDSQELANNIGSGVMVVAMDAAGQNEVFRKNAYGGLDEAVNKYREENRRLEEMYLKSKDRIEELYNKNMLNVDDDLKNDEDVQEINSLAAEAVNNFNAFVENTKSPSGTYRSYSEESNSKFEKAKSSHESLKTRLKYIIEKNGVSQEEIDEKAKNNNKENSGE